MRISEKLGNLKNKKSKKLKQYSQIKKEEREMIDRNLILISQFLSQHHLRQTVIGLNKCKLLPMLREEPIKARL